MKQFLFSNCSSNDEGQEASTSTKNLTRSENIDAICSADSIPLSNNLCSRPNESIENDFEQEFTDSGVINKVYPNNKMENAIKNQGDKHENTGVGLNSDVLIIVTSCNCSDDSPQDILTEHYTTTGQPIFEHSNVEEEEEDCQLQMMEAEKRNTVIISAAKRSLQTNMLILTLFIFLLTLEFMAPGNWRPYLNVLLFSSMKGILPILTTIVNFGPVKTMAIIYWEYFNEVFKSIFSS